MSKSSEQSWNDILLETVEGSWGAEKKISSLDGKQNSKDAIMFSSLSLLDSGTLCHDFCDPQHLAQGLTFMRHSIKFYEMVKWTHTIAYVKWLIL